MNRIKLLIEYDGTDYIGWQNQNNGRSIQQEIETTLADEVLFGKLQKGGQVHIGLKKNKLQFKYN